jgi:activator of Hsp90 ATPase-like protein
MAFFGRYVEVIPHSRLVWTNDEGEEAGPVTTVTFEERGDETLVTRYTTSIPQRKLSTMRSPLEVQVGTVSRSSSWTSFSSPCKRAWVGPETLDPHLEPATRLTSGSPIPFGPDND